jgi:hypothetical protein
MSAPHPFTQWARLLGIIEWDENIHEARKAVRYLFNEYGHGLGVMSSDISVERKEEAWSLSMTEEVRREIEACKSRAVREEE